MIEGLIISIFGPFILIGILIAGLGLITGARVDGLLRDYARLCTTLFVNVLVPAVRGATYLLMRFGDKLRYVLDTNSHSINTADFIVKVAPLSQQKSEDQAKSFHTQQNKRQGPNDDPIDVEVVND
jgi:hypothetical protein